MKITPVERDDERALAFVSPYARALKYQRMALVAIGVNAVLIAVNFTLLVVLGLRVFA